MMFRNTFQRAIVAAAVAALGVLPLSAADAQGRFAEAQAEREAAGQGEYFALFADAAWTAAEAGVEPMPGLRGEAYTALQDAMAGSANRAIVEMAVRRFADDAGEGLGALVRERQSLAEQWNANNELYALTFGGSGDSDAAMRENLAGERAGIEARMDEIDATLRADFPEYFGLIRPEALSLEDTAALLAPDEAILLTLPTDFGTHVMAVTSEGATWARSEWTKEEVASAVRRLRWEVGASVNLEDGEEEAWSAAIEEGSPFPFDRTTAHALYNAVVAPVAGSLEGKRHLYIAAGGELSTLPFSLLVAEPPQGADNDPAALRGTAWFADAHAITHIPSIQSLQLLRRFNSGDSAAAEGFAGFGDPLLNGRAQSRGLNRGLDVPEASAVFTRERTRSGGGVADVRALRNLARLPGTAVELRNMREALGAPESSIHLGAEATETAVRGADLSDAAILAFATHGLMAGELDEFAEPGLVLTPPSSASEEDDGYLAASEVAALRLNADWVILSACNTASGGSEGAAAGLSGLARAFFYAGARNLLASHWPVNDDVASRITVRTIEMRRADPSLSRAEAFQSAMREIREDTAQDTAQASWAHPAFWAPFTLVGDGAR
ncbi:MAG: CHAT domain-containing protein [Sphingomonadaceae bacterium]|nr:CHAT domain-containing protein [Sphingomonadaceae bacterium]